MENNLRNRTKANGLNKKSKGFACSIEETLETKKKLLLLNQDDDNNNGFVQNLETTDDNFADTFTSKPEHHHAKVDEVVEIFNETAKDQFAAALLRLQTDLDSTNKRMLDIEIKMESLIKKQESKNNQSKQKATNSSKGHVILNWDNLGNLVYFGWPIVVYLAMRAIERRNSLKAQ